MIFFLLKYQDSHDLKFPGSTGPFSTASCLAQAGGDSTHLDTHALPPHKQQHDKAIAGTSTPLNAPRDEQEVKLHFERLNNCQSTIFHLQHFSGLSNRSRSPAKLEEFLQQNWKKTGGRQPRTRG